MLRTIPLLAATGAIASAFQYSNFYDSYQPTNPDPSTRLHHKLWSQPTPQPIRDWRTVSPPPKIYSGSPQLAGFPEYSLPFHQNDFIFSDPGLDKSFGPALTLDPFGEVVYLPSPTVLGWGWIGFDSSKWIWAPDPRSDLYAIILPTKVLRQDDMASYHSTSDKWKYIVIHGRYYLVPTSEMATVRDVPVVPNPRPILNDQYVPMGFLNFYPSTYPGWGYLKIDDKWLWYPFSRDNVLPPTPHQPERYLSRLSPDYTFIPLEATGWGWLVVTHGEQKRYLWGPDPESPMTHIFT